MPKVYDLTVSNHAWTIFESSVRKYTRRVMNLAWKILKETPEEYVPEDAESKVKYLVGIAKKLHEGTRIIIKTTIPNVTGMQVGRMRSDFPVPPFLAQQREEIRTEMMEDGYGD